MASIAVLRISDFDFREAAYDLVMDAPDLLGADEAISWGRFKDIREGSEYPPTFVIYGSECGPSDEDCERLRAAGHTLKLFDETSSELTPIRAAVHRNIAAKYAMFETGSSLSRAGVVRKALGVLALIRRLGPTEH